MKKFTIIIKTKGLIEKRFDMQANDLDHAKKQITYGFTLPHKTFQTEWSFYSEKETEKLKETQFGFFLSFQLSIDGQDKIFVPNIYIITIVEHISD